MNPLAALLVVGFLVWIYSDFVKEAKRAEKEAERDMEDPSEDIWR